MRETVPLNSFLIGSKLEELVPQDWSRLADMVSLSPVFDLNVGLEFAKFTMSGPAGPFPLIFGIFLDGIGPKIHLYIVITYNF